MLWVLYQVLLVYWKKHPEIPNNSKPTRFAYLNPMRQKKINELPKAPEFKNESGSPSPGLETTKITF